jgi:NADH-quinone oxidoreductase subunit E
MDYTTILHRYAPLPENLLMILHDVQKADPRSHVSPEAIESIAAYLNTTLARVYGVVGYYSMLSAEPRGRHIIRLCNSPVCRMKGSFDLLETLHTQLGISLNETTEDGVFSLESSECLGNCHHAPSLMIDEVLYSSVTRESLTTIIERLRREASDV